VDTQQFYGSYRTDWITKFSDGANVRKVLLLPSNELVNARLAVSALMNAPVVLHLTSTPADCRRIDASDERLARPGGRNNWIGLHEI
jgi:hypothetical protein